MGRFFREGDILVKIRRRILRDMFYDIVGVKVRRRVGFVFGMREVVRVVWGVIEGEVS